MGGLGALGVAAASALGACSSDSTPHAVRGPRATTTTRIARPVDPSQPWWLQGDFAPVEREVEAVDLAVEGTLPRDLSGLYVRNGSNPLPGW